MFKPREYQNKAVEIGLEVLRDKKGRKEVMVVPTAGGKSFIIALLSRELIDGAVLVLSPSIELLEQNVFKIESFGIFPSVYSASAKRRELGKLIYATPKSLNYEILKDANIKYVIMDECDFSSQKGSNLTTLLNKLKIKSVLGLSATPLYMNTTQDGTETIIMTQAKGSFFKDICYVVNPQELMKLGFWSDIKYYNVYDRSKEELLILNTSASEYTEESSKDFYEKAGLKNKIATFIKRIPKGESALIFVPSINDVDELVELIPNSVGVHSKTDKKLRKQYVDDFKSDKIQVVITAMALLTGFDKENLTNIVDGSPSNSIRIKIQKDGRGVRIHPNKKLCNIVDFAGNYNRFGDVRDIRLEYVEGYGWGVFSKDKLLTDVLMSSKEVITLEDLKDGKRPNKNSFTFSFENKGDAKMSQGKFKGKELRYLYYKKRFYLKYLIEKNYKFCKEDEEFERQLKDIYK